MNPFGAGLVGDIKSIVDCAYKSLSGELYVTKRALCFRRTGLFGIETDRVIIPFEIVQHISEDQQNGLIVVTSTDKDKGKGKDNNETDNDSTNSKSYHFSSVKDLDNLLSLLNRIWEEARDAPDRVRKSAVSVDKILRKITTLTPSQSDIDVRSSFQDESSSIVSASLINEHESETMATTAVARNRVILDLSSMEEEHEHTQVSDDVEELMSAGIEAMIKREYSQKIATNVSLDFTVDEFFNTFLADDAPCSLPFHHEKCGDYDIKCTNWVKIDTGEFQRRISYKHPIHAPMGPPFGTAEKTQVMKRFGDHGLIIVTKTWIKGVPMADCFYVEDCLLVQISSNSDHGSGSGVSLSSMYDLEFVKSTMFKKIITFTSLNDLTKFHSSFVESMKKHAGEQCEAAVDEREEELREAMDAAYEGYKQIVAKNTQLDCTVDQFFNTFLADDAPHSLVSHHEKCGDTDIRKTKWQDNGVSDEFCRRIAYKHSVNIPMGPRFGEAEKTQVMKRFNGHGLIIVSKTWVNDVPLTDSFYVEDCLLVSSNLEGGISLSLIYDLKFVKNTMFKKVITLTTVGELSRFYGGFLELINDGVSEIVHGDTSGPLVVPDEPEVVKSPRIRSSNQRNLVQKFRENFLRSISSTTGISELNPFVLIAFLTVVTSQVYLMYQLNSTHKKMALLEAFVLNKSEALECSSEE